MSILEEIRLSAAINHQLSCRPSMVLCDNDVQTTRHLPGDSGSLEKALGSGPSGS